MNYYLLYISCMNKTIAITALIVVFLGSMLFYYVKSQKSSNPTSSNVSLSSQVQMTKNFSLAEVARHNTSNNCWMAIDGNVYDMSSLVQSNTHPGGDVINQGCGKDATDLFTNRKGKGPHSPRAQEKLQEYEIGTLK